MVIPAAGGQPRTLAESLDRPVRHPLWSKDGRSLTVVVVDDRSQYPARIPVNGGSVEGLLTAKGVLRNLSAGGPGRAFAVLAARDTQLPGAAALENRPVAR